MCDSLMKSSEITKQLSDPKSPIEVNTKPTRVKSAGKQRNYGGKQDENMIDEDFDDVDLFFDNDEYGKV